MITKNDGHFKAIGKFYRIADEYINKFKIGGKQKLQKLIGSDLFYKKGKNWYWNNPIITRMNTDQIKHYIKIIENK